MKILKVGDKLRFISEDHRSGFLKEYDGNLSLIRNCFSRGVSLISKIGENYIQLKFYDGSKLSCLFARELTYFRKVEQVEENTNLSDEEVQDLRQDLKDSYNEFEQLDKEVCYVLVDAGIESIKEVYSRLLEGEVFYFKDEKYVFEGDYFYTYYSDGGCDTDINSLDDFEQFRVKTPWYKFVSEENPVLCKVWDTQGDNVSYAEVVFKEEEYYTSERYCTTEGVYWDYAVPVKPSECYQGE